MNLPKKVVHLLSGGIDSVVLLHDLLSQSCDVHCLLVDYKQRHVQELNCARHHCHQTGVLYTTVELPQLLGSQLTDGQGGPVLPGRNAILLSIAANLAAFAKADSVTFAANADDCALFPDCRMAFVQTFNNMLMTSEVPVEVCAPYIQRSKRWVVARGRELGVDLAQTWSCYQGGVEPCGQCVACLQRTKAMQ